MSTYRHGGVMRNKEKKLLSEIELLIAENKSVKRNDDFGSIDIDESEKMLTEILESERKKSNKGDSES